MNKKKINIFLVDDHQIVRDGIKSLLLDSTEIEITGEASYGKELMEKIELIKPDVILMDISLPDISGIELTRQITKQYPEIKIVILSMYTQEEFITNAIAAGAKGYLPKNTTQQELFNAIMAVHAGKEYYNESVSKIILENYISTVRKSNETNAEDEKENLSGREKQILKLYVEGLSNQEIADKLFISIRTVESHKNHMMQKLGVKSTVELVKYAIRNNIAEA
ncbi:MAG TPA: response regulator transcription factor [Bacteroidales bacterium]|nr:response regulator transcription factor [Bacteroidales bacterium]HPS17518.1 response regulator transcription factor [Bacteroidales bacterium]